MEYNFIYVCSIISADGKFSKVGYTKDLESRMGDIQTGCPYEIFLESVFAVTSKGFAQAVEKAAHVRLALNALHVRGEWFKAGRKEINPAIREAARERGINIVQALHFGKGQAPTYSKIGLYMQQFNKASALSGLRELQYTGSEVLYDDIAKQMGAAAMTPAEELDAIESILAGDIA